MTSKRLGILLFALFALWSLMGPSGRVPVLDEVGIAVVGEAQAGDPDQYTNRANGAGCCEPDSTGSNSTPSTPDEDGDGDRGGRTSRIFDTVLKVASLLMWGLGGATS